MAWSRTIAAVVVLAGACGSGDRDQRAEAAAAAWRVVDSEADDVLEADETASSLASPSSTSSITTTTTTLVPPTPTDPPRADPPTIGSLELPCGRPGDASGVGVDDTRIVIGVGSDRGSLHAADSARGVVETIRALADHCNGLGGIAGRQIVVEEFDAAVIEVDDRMAEACESVFSLVGHAYLWDDAAEGIRLECGLPAFPAWSPGVGDQAPALAAGLPAIPVPVPTRGNLVALATSPELGGRIALVGPATTGGRSGRSVRTLGLAFSGLPVEVVADLGYPVDVEPDWDAVVGEARADAGVVDFVGACRSALVPFLQAAATVGWDPVVVAGPEAYDPACLPETEGDLFARVLVEMPLLPVEDGRLAPATAAVVAILEPLGVPITGDALRAPSSFWLWATAAESCGADLDRDCVVERRAVAIDEWTAGGLHAPSDPGMSAMVPCAVLLGVEDGRFVRRLPVDPGTFDCVSPADEAADESVDEATDEGADRSDAATGTAG